MGWMRYSLLLFLSFLPALAAADYPADSTLSQNVTEERRARVSFFSPSAVGEQAIPRGILWPLGQASPQVIVYRGGSQTPQFDTALILPFPILSFRARDLVDGGLTVRGGGLFRLSIIPGRSTFGFDFFDGVAGIDAVVSLPRLNAILGPAISLYWKGGLEHRSSHTGDGAKIPRFADSREKLWAAEGLTASISGISLNLQAGIGRFVRRSGLPVILDQWIASEISFPVWQKLYPFAGVLFRREFTDEGRRANVDRLNDLQRVYTSFAGEAGVRVSEKFDCFLHHYSGNSPYGQIFGQKEIFSGIGLRYKL